MNYQDNRVYMQPPAMRPLDMYSVKSQLTNQLSLTADSLVNLGQVTNDHASRIDELRNDLENLRALVLWIGEAHPDVLRQYRGIKDLERASR